MIFINQNRSCHPSLRSGSAHRETLRGVYPERSEWAQGDNTLPILVVKTHNRYPVTNHKEVQHMLSKKAFYSYVLILTTFLLLLSGCVSPSGTSNSSGIKASVGVDLTNKMLTLGILTPLSGPVADPIGK